MRRVRYPARRQRTFRFCRECPMDPTEAVPLTPKMCVVPASEDKTISGNAPYRTACSVVVHRLIHSAFQTQLHAARRTLQTLSKSAMRIGWGWIHRSKWYAKLTAIANHFVWWVVTHPMGAVHSLFRGCAPTYPQRFLDSASRGEANAKDAETS